MPDRSFERKHKARSRRSIPVPWPSAIAAAAIFRAEIFQRPVLPSGRPVCLSESGSVRNAYRASADGFGERKTASSNEWWDNRAKKGEG
jgi:hypothetical protein